MDCEVLTDPLVSILIPNWNSLEHIQQCIDCVIKSTYRPVETILIDNNSNDGSVEFVSEKYPSVKILRNRENLGFASAMNIGIREATGDLIVLLNQDAFLDTRWLGQVVRALMESHDVGAACGKLFYWNPNSPLRVFCTWSKVDPYTGMPYNFSDDEPASRVDYVTGAAMMVKREVIESIGDLDTGYFLYFDETDWCARMIRAGYKLLYLPDAIAWHVLSSSISDSQVKTYYMIRNRIRFVLKNFDLSHIPLFMIFYFFESFYEFLTNLRRMDFTETKIRLRALCWNLRHVVGTLCSRRRDLSLLGQRNKMVLSYNSNLPLRRYKVGWVEKHLSRFGRLE